METNKIYQGECITELKKIPDESIDLIIIDPPYFNQGTKPKYSRKGKTDVIANQGEWDIFESDKKYLDFMKLVICECCRVLKKDGSFYCFTNDRYISYLRHFIRDVEGMTYASTIIWHKYNSPPRFIMKPGFISSKEIIMFAYKGKNPIFNKPKEFKEMLDVWITPQAPSGERLGHPTQKPLSLIKRLINISSNKGDVVLDCFAGSGTTGMACIQLERVFILIEKDAKYFKMCEDRLKPHLQQTKIDGGKFFSSQP